MLLITIPAKVQIKSCRFARECVSLVHAYNIIDATTQMESRLHEQTQIVANAAYGVGSQQFLS